jgi:hypothetical protein
MALRRRVGPVRRGEFFPFVPTATPTAPARAPDWLRQRRPAPRRAPHGEFFSLVPTAVAAAAPARAPDWLQRHRPAARRPSRGDFFPTVPLTQPVPALTTRRRPVRSPGRRGELWTVPLVGAVAGFGPWVPALLQRRRTPPQIRRGEFLLVPLVGLAPSGPPPFIPPPLTHRPVRTLQRRGEFLPVAPAPAFCAAPLPRRKRPATTTRRGRGWTAPPVTLPPPGPGPWLPRTQRAAARSAPRRMARGRYWPLAVESACDCLTHRPSSGITVRPGAAVTVRPATGTTTRPCTCQGG